MAGTEVGSAYVSIYPDTSHFTDKLSEGLVASVNSANSPFTFALGNLISSAVSRVAALVGDNFMRGIERFDTIQNFPKLMEAFGYSTREADAAVKMVANHLDGLPGSTDEVLRLVQSISDSTDSLSLATTTGLAFNDMLTASGADAATTTAAMRIFDQIMGGGLSNITRWQALTSKMPLQFNMLAKEILGASASSEDLGRAIISGDVSLQQLAQTMTDKMPEFEAQARAMSDGVGTAITNIPNRVAAGWAAIMEVIGQGNISAAINNFSYGLRDSMKFIAAGLADFMARNSLQLSSFKILFSRIVDAIAQSAKSFPWSDIQSAASAAIGALNNLMRWALANGDIIQSVIRAVTVVLTGFIAAGLLGKIYGAVAALFALIAANPIGAVVVAVGALVAGLKYFFTETERGRAVWKKLTTALSNGIGNLGKVFSSGWQFISNATKTAFNAIKTVVTAALNAIKAIVTTILKAIVAIYKAEWNAIKTVVTVALNAIKTIITTIFNAIKAVVSTVLNGVLSVVTAIFGKIKTAITTPTNAIRDTVGAAFERIKALITSPVEAIGNTVNRVFGGLAGIVGGAIRGAQSAINGFTGKTVDLKVNNSTAAGVTAAKNAVNGFTGKTVSLNAKMGDINSVVKQAKGALAGLSDRTVKINFYAYQSGIKGVDISTSTSVAGNKRIQANPIRLYAAAGGIATKAVAGIFGEAGDEALVPLSNRAKVRPFARAVAAEIPSNGGGVTVTGNTFIVRKDSDIPAIADAINLKVNRELAGAL